MDERRLPGWISFTGASGSPRRAAHFDNGAGLSKRCSGVPPSAIRRAPKEEEAVLPVHNPFVSSHDLVEYHLIKEKLRESLLVHYCRAGLWEQALERCESHPQEALPRPYTPEVFEEMWSPFCHASDEDQVTLYEHTPLGSLVGSTDMRAAPLKTIVALVSAICRQHHIQVSASQKIKGNTPMRQAIVNPFGTPPEVIAVMLRQPDALDALTLPDNLGVYPIDHLLQHVRRQVSETTQMSLLETFVQNAPLHQIAFEKLYSPLVRFYSTTSDKHGRLQQSWKLLLSVNTSRKTRTTPKDGVVLSTRVLIEAAPQILSTPSPSTGCMPIHAALRNYGSRSELIETLLSSDMAGSLQFMLHRNNFGDLPLHVACACGVPVVVLKLVLTRTVQAVLPFRKYEKNPRLWSTNHAGYTPVDLEWIRHIEAGNGFLSHAVFQPIGVEGIPRPRGRYDDLYDKLLRQAVDQLIESKTAVLKSSAVTTQDTFGLLLHRILLIVRAMFRDSFSLSPDDLSGDILHQTSALLQPRGPSMPEPIMDLLLWQYPEQVQLHDHCGRAPLHYAVHLMTSSEISERKSSAWERWVQKLISKSPLQTVRSVDARGRTALHILLSTPHANEEAVVCTQVENVALRLARLHPEAVHLRDPIGGLFPAFQAASNPMVSIDTVFSLLRRAPKVLGLREFIVHSSNIIPKFTVTYSSCDMSPYSQSSAIEDLLDLRWDKPAEVQ